MLLQQFWYVETPGFEACEFVLKGLDAGLIVVTHGALQYLAHEDAGRNFFDFAPP